MNVLRRLNPFVSEQRVFVTRLTGHECAERLWTKLFVDGSRPAAWGGSAKMAPVYGLISTRRFVVFQGRKSRWRRSDFHRTEASGQFLSSGEGTRVAVRLASAEEMRLGSMVLYLFLLIQLGVSAFVVLHGPVTVSWAALLLVSVVALMALVLGLHYLAFLYSPAEGEFLLRFLRETLEAEEVEGGLTGALSTPAG